MIKASHLRLILAAWAVLFFLIQDSPVVEAKQGGVISAAPFYIGDRGGVSAATFGPQPTVVVGYASVQTFGGSTTPAGVAIFGFRQNNTLISEAGVPASHATTSGRIYAEVDGFVNTGMAIANPNAQSATISFYFTDETGQNFGAGSTTLAPGAQIARFLNQDPFDGGSTIKGTFTFNSDVPVAVVALQGLTNERSEFLLTTLPVDPLPDGTTGTAYFPDFADGGGWTTQVALVNPTDSALTGSVQFFGQGSASSAAQPTPVTINGQTATTFPYTIPGRSSLRLRTDGLNATTVVGSIQIIPSQNNQTPSGSVVFSFRNANVTVAEAGVPATRPGLAFRMYAETTGPQNGAIQTGIAIANPANVPVAVKLELTTFAGTATGFTGAVTIPGNGQASLFLNQVPGFESLATPFQGILRISTGSSRGIAVTGLRGRYNERGDFLITTTPPVDEAIVPTSAPSFFPHLADGGGYTTQFVLFSGSANQTTSGSLMFFTQKGLPFATGLTESITGNVVATVAVNHGGDSMDAGGVIQLTASASDAIGAVVPGRPVSWTSTDEHVLRVSSTGLVTGVNAGSARINATIDKVVGSVTLNVGAVSPYAFTEVGRVLGPSDEGFPSGGQRGTADVSAVELADKRIRIYFGIFTGVPGALGKIGSAISTDGTHFTIEDGLRQPSDAGPMEGFASPLIYPLPGGGYRLYYNGCHPIPGGCGISSATSADGLTFIADKGVRLTSPIANDAEPACSGIVRRAEGGYRMYCSAIAISPGFGSSAPELGAVFSAVSPDLLAWTVEPGIRIGPGATSLTGNANHPTAIVNPDGSVSLVYYQWPWPDPGTDAREMIATSKDGLTFDSEINTGILGSEPSLLQRSDGSLLLYHGGTQAQVIGSTIAVSRVAVHP